MSEIKIIAASIVNFLKQQLEGDILTSDAKESLEVGVQCIETAFEITPEDCGRGLDLVQLVREQVGKSVITPEAKAEAEKLRVDGNNLMKQEKPKEALEKYTKAIELDPFNAVYFCNRAAAQFKLGQHEAAVADCTAALGIQPDYSKALGRMGLAFTALGKHREARSAYANAAQLDPENESYKTNLRLAEEQLAQSGERPAIPDLGNFLQNPALLNMATEMLSDPGMQNLISGLMSNTSGGGGGVGAGGVGAGGAAGGGLDALLQAGQALAQQMQAANPDLVEHLRRNVGARNPPGNGTPPQQ